MDQRSYSGEGDGHSRKGNESRRGCPSQPRPFGFNYSSCQGASLRSQFLNLRNLFAANPADPSPSHNREELPGYSGS